MSEIVNSIYDYADVNLDQAVNRIFSDYDDKVSINKKAKSLLKFGKSAALTTGSLQTVWTVGGNETYLTTNTITHVSSSSASDTSLIGIEYHTISGSGTNEEFTFGVQQATLDGQNKVTLSVPCARVSRIYEISGNPLVGRIVVYEDTTISGGVPTDASKIHIDIPTGLQQSFKCATTISKGDYYIITSGFGSVSLKQAASVDFYLEARSPGGVFRQRTALGSSSTSGPWYVPLEPAFVVPKNHDVRVRVEAGTANAVAFCNLNGYLAEVI